MRRFPIALLATVAAGAGAAAPADAAWTVIGSDLAKSATIAHSDPNDVVFWPTATPGAIAGIDVPVKGQAIKLRVKGGTRMTEAEYAEAKRLDENFDLFQVLVLRQRADGTWRAEWSSKSLTMPRIGKTASSDTITEYKAGADNPMCVQPGDRIAVASVGGYTPRLFEQGLPYQIFAAAPGAQSVGYRHATDPDRERQGGKIQLSESHPSAPGNPPTTIRTTDTFADQELLLQVTVGTGGNARFTCGGSAPTGSEAGDLPEVADAPAGGGAGGAGGSGSGGSTPAAKAAMGVPRKATVRLARDGRVPVSVTCRADGKPCAGKIELRVHKRAIGSARYALAPGKRGSFKVRLTRRGRYFVRADSDGRMLTTVRVTADGGRQKVGKITILPAKKRRR